jgi:hypothetical protein
MMPHRRSSLPAFSSVLRIGAVGLSLLGALTPLLALDQRYTYRTEQELQGFIDSNNDGLLDVILIDRSNGRYRIGLRTGAGLTWEGPYPTGISDPSDFSVAPITISSRDQLVVTGPQANRLHLINTWNASALSDPLTVLPTGQGPSAVAALDIGLPGNDPGRSDLVVVSKYNNAPGAYRRHLMLATSTVSETGSQTSSLPLEATARVLTRTSQPPRLANMFRGSSPDSDALFIADASSALLLTVTSLTGLPMGTEFIHGAFKPLTPDAIQFLLFTPGGSDLLIASIDPASQTFPSTPTVHPLGRGPIDGVYVARRANVNGVVVIFDNGREAAFYLFDASMSPLLQEVLLPPAGLRFTGALSFANNRLSLLAGTSFHATSTEVIDFNGSSGTWTESGTESLPPVGNQSVLSNVFLYESDPLVNPGARLIRAVHIPDWTSNLSIDGSSNVSLTVEDFTSPLGGLAFSASGTFLKEPGATFGYTNQVRDDISLSSTASLLGGGHIDIAIEPAPGAYAEQIEPQLLVPDVGSLGPGFQAWYRVAEDEPWVAFDVTDPAEVILPPDGSLLPFMVWYYAEDTTTGARSAIKTASYTWIGLPDSDSDGVPDFVEKARGLNPRDGPDSDGDGFSDLEEILSGSDPDDPLSTPAFRFAGILNAFDLAVRPLMHNGNLNSPVFRPTWPDSHSDFDGAVFRAWNLDGRLYGTATTENEGIVGIADPVVLFPELPVEDKDAFLIITSTRTFPFNQVQGLQGTAPELIGMVPVPTTLQAPPPFIPDPQKELGSNVDDWIQFMRTYYDDLERPLVTAEIGPLESLKFLLTERILGLLADADPLSLTGFRDPLPPQEEPQEGINATVPQASLLAIQAYEQGTADAWSLQSIYAQVSSIIDTSSDFRVQELVQLATDLFGIWVANTNSPSPNPGLYPSPFDVLREVVQDMPESGLDDDSLPLPGRNNNPQVSYAGDLALTPLEQRSVERCLAFILGQLQMRPRQGFLAEVTPSTFAGSVPVLEIPSTGNELHLLTAANTPYPFSPSAALPVGAVIQVLAFTDRYSLPQVEVISADLVSVPLPQQVDLDGNLIDDSLQAVFAAQGFDGDPFADPDEDGYMTWQELLEQTNPLLFNSQPATSAVQSFPPVVTVNLASPTQVQLSFDFPASYAGQIGFLLESGSSLEALNPTSSAFDAEPASGDTWTSDTSPPSTDSTFYRFRAFLK